MDKNYIILEGKDMDELINEGLDKLNKSKNEVEIEVIEEGKSIIGLFKKNSKIKMTIKGEAEKNIDEEEIDNVLQHLDEIGGNSRKSFEIKYLEDGVYLSVYKIISSDEILTNRIMSRISRKKIQDYDVNAIKEAIELKNEDSIKIAPPQEEQKKNSEIVIEIFDKNMFAYMTLLPPLGGKNITFDEAIAIIEEKLGYGIFYEEVKEVIVNEIYNKKTLIAKGKDPIHGKDGTITYNFDIEKTDNRVTVMEDGSVDYRNLNLITNVNQGDILAEMTLPTKGEEGFTVTGEVLAAKEGKLKSLRFGKNVRLSEDELKLIAECDGQVTIEGGKVTVREVYVVQANVDNSTGNIDFNGIVKVKGNVRTGFNIKAEGDIEVNGVVEAAYLESGANIILKRGMQGHNDGKLIAKGDIVAKYLENTYLFSDGNIQAEAIMHSQIFSKGTIEIAGKKGLLVGGVCKAKHEIRAKTIGSTMATATELEVGVDPNIKAEYENISREIDATETNIDKLKKSITLLNRLAKNNQITKDKKQLLIKCISDRNTLTNTLNELKEELLDIENQIEMLSKGKILAKDIIYPGVKITIGKNIMFVKKEIKHCSIYLEDGEIKIGSYE
ncbi:DUF342 domain-containing protein [Sporosalibacterium faouarense]|uniref:DUF342 domain-containing protein n=1 Tax=Sporosalibacterium faouarense TaxID=516123 RepID=UPI00192AD81E|nr:FapA family protein [Sporosalibacterium faouarense]